MPHHPPHHPSFLSSTPPARLFKGLAATLGALTLAVCHASPAMAQDNDSSESGSAPARLALVIDASDSMAQTDVDGGSRMDAAKDATIDVLKGLDSDVEAGLIAYGTTESNAPDNRARGCEDIKVLSGVGTPDVNALEADIRALQPTGYTPIGKSLEKAAAELGDEGKRSIVLVSDGEDTCAPPEVCEVAKDLAGAGVDLAIHTVGFRVSGKAQEELECIAEATGGTYSAADNTDSLKQTLSTVVTRAAQAYDAQGTPLELKDNPDDGLYVGEGQYLSHLPGGEANVDGAKGVQRWFKVSIPENTVAHLSAATIAPLKLSDASGGFINTQVEVRNSSCDAEYSGNNSSYDYPDPAIASMVSVTNEEGCDPDGWLVGVNRQGHANADDLPVEILVGFEPIVTGAKAGPEDPGTSGDKREGDIRPTKDPRPVKGGSSYNTAAPVEPGSITDSIVAGEVRYYKMPVEWGQRPIARIEFEPRKAKELRDPIVTIFNPWRVEFEGFDSKLLEEDKPIEFEHQQSYFAYYSNQVHNQISVSTDAEQAAYAGDWYIAVGLDGSQANGTDSAQENYTLTFDYEGAKVEGPAWRPTTANGPEPSEDPIHSATGGSSSENGENKPGSQAGDVEENSSASDSEGTGTNWVTIGLIGLAAVLVMGAAVTLGRIRQRD